MKKTADRLAFERKLLADGLVRIAGVDEAGRGPLAGPVVAAAVILPTQWIQEGLPGELAALNDSKQLSESQRETFFEILTGNPAVEKGVASSDSTVVDRINILQATYQAMLKSLAQLTPVPDHILVDGRPVPPLRQPQTAIVKGDALSSSIAAASVLAKVTRDRWMLEMDALYPAYGFAVHKGYGTPDHLEAIRKHGPCPIHRLSFSPMRPEQPELF